jgi:hypothetical protein
VTNVGTDKSQLANMANQGKAALGAESLEAVADRGFFKGEEATEMVLHVLAYNLTRVMNIVGIKPLLAAIRA